MIARLISYRQIFFMSQFLLSSMLTYVKKVTPERNPMFAPSFPRPSRGTQERCLLTVAGGCCRDLSAVSLFILLAGFLVLESWLGKSLYSSPIFQGVKRWVCTSLNNRSILKTFFRDRYVQSPNKKPQLDFELIFEDYTAAYYNHNVIAYYNSLFAFCSIELFILLALFPLRWEETELSNNAQENLIT